MPNCSHPPLATSMQLSVGGSSGSSYRISLKLLADKHRIGDTHICGRHSPHRFCGSNGSSGLSSRKRLTQTAGRLRGCLKPDPLMSRSSFMVIAFPDGVGRRLHERWHDKQAEAEAHYSGDRSDSNRIEYLRLLRIFAALVIRYKIPEEV
jgi:hypothetical protein